MAQASDEIAQALRSRRTPTSATPTSRSAATTSSSCATGSSASSRATSKQIVPRLDQPVIVIARDLSPADTAGMVREPVIGFVTEIGTRTSHTAIMARALEIPAVVGVADALSIVRTGDTLVVDGLRGEVVVNPSDIMIEEARGRGARHLAFARGLLTARNQPCVTRDGEPVALKANVELPAEAILALDHGAEGIGLYRTEFIYIDRRTMPTEDEQYELYRAVVEAVAPAARDAPHVRHRRRQVRVELPAPGGDEPGARPARGAPRALAARRVPDAAPRDAPRERARRPSHHGAHGRERAGAARGAAPARPRHERGRRRGPRRARSTSRSG